MPTTVEECAELKAWADAQPPRRPEPVTTDQLARHLSFMAATLPTKNLTEDESKKRVAVYSALLAEYGNSALGYMARRACATLDWFPTPKQCIEILSEYREPESDRSRALTYCHQFTQARFEAWMAGVTAGTTAPDEINAVPDQWRRIALERGALRLVDGAYQIRRKPDPIAEAEEITIDELLTWSASARRTALGKGWITQEQFDACAPKDDAI